jgi:CTP:phosphocholine cytidylyltransferase-like protein
MKVFIFNDDDGYMAIGTPCYQSYMNDEEKDNFLMQVIEKSVPKKPDGSDRPVFIKTQDELKVADVFIDAFSVNEIDGSIFFNRPRAIELKKKEFRLRRKPLLEKLDVDFMKSLEVGNTILTTEIIYKKQILRDITNIDMSHCDTPEKLYNYIPEELKTV